MALEYIFTNNATSELAVVMGGSDLTLQVTSGDGSLFPDPTDGSERFVVQVKQGSTQVNMVCTGRSSDILTVTRADSKSFTVGTLVRLILIDDILESFIQKEAFRTNDGDPDGVLTADYEGEEVYDSTNTEWYKNCGGGTTWKTMSGGS